MTLHVGGRARHRAVDSRRSFLLAIYCRSGCCTFLRGDARPTPESRTAAERTCRLFRAHVKTELLCTSLEQRGQ